MPRSRTNHGEESYLRTLDTNRRQQGRRSSLPLVERTERGETYPCVSRSSGNHGPRIGTLRVLGHGHDLDVYPRWKPLSFVLLLSDDTDDLGIVAPYHARQRVYHAAELVQVGALDGVRDSLRQGLRTWKTKIETHDDCTINQDWRGMSLCFQTDQIPPRLQIPVRGRDDRSSFDDECPHGPLWNRDATYLEADGIGHDC